MKTWQLVVILVALVSMQGWNERHVSTLMTQLAEMKTQIAALAPAKQLHEPLNLAEQQGNIRLVCKYSEANVMNCVIYSKEDISSETLKQTAREAGWEFIDACPYDFMQDRYEGESCLGIWVNK